MTGTRDTTVVFTEMDVAYMTTGLQDHSNGIFFFDIGMECIEEYSKVVPVDILNMPVSVCKCIEEITFEAVQRFSSNCNLPLGGIIGYRLMQFSYSLLFFGCGAGTGEGAQSLVCRPAEEMGAKCFNTIDAPLQIVQTCLTN